jgi:hypothetical protein
VVAKRNYLNDKVVATRNGGFTIYGYVKVVAKEIN